MSPLNYTYPWLPGPGQSFDDDALTDDQAKGLRDLVREVVQNPAPKNTDDLIFIALTKGKRHARFAMECLQAEREGVAFAVEASALKREALRDSDLKRLQVWVIALSIVATLATIAQVLVAIKYHA